MKKRQSRSNKKQHVKTAKGRSVHSTHWLNRHINDPFVSLAKKEGYCSRAAFKLLEIDSKFAIFSKAPKGVIIDLGCAPGSWMQVCQKVAPSSKVIGVDLKDIDKRAIREGALFILGDFTKEQTLENMRREVGDIGASIILSDMAANSCGDRAFDHIRIVELVNLALDFAEQHMNKGGHGVFKILRGAEDKSILKRAEELFASVRLYKPSASYEDSAELFLVAKHFIAKTNIN